MAKNVFIQMRVEEFRNNLNKCLQLYKKQTSSIVKQSTPVFLNAVIKQTPPNAGKLIPNFRLFNPTVDLMAVARNRPRKWIFGVKDQTTEYKLTSRDGVEMHNGMRYKILIRNKRKKGIVYCKSKADARRIAYITTRGLMRSSWASDIESIGISRTSIPNLINILKLNPQLNKFNFNRIYETKGNNDLSQINIQNLDIYANQGFLGKAMTKGFIEASKYMRRQINNLVNKDIEV